MVNVTPFTRYFLSFRDLVGEDWSSVKLVMNLTLQVTTSLRYDVIVRVRTAVIELRI